MVDFQSNSKNLHIASFLFNMKETVIASFFMVYILRLGATNFQVGLYEPVIAFVGIITLLTFSVYLDNSKKNFLRCAALDRLVFVLFCIALIFIKHPIWIIIFYGLYSVPVALTGALSSNYMKDSIPREKWGRVFAHNKMVLIASNMLTLFFVGMLLDKFQYAFPYNFIIIFAAGSIVYLTSYYFLRKIENDTKKCHANIDRMHALKHIDSGMLFILLFQAVVYIANPLWAIYHIKELNLTNFQFSILNCAFYFAGFIALPFLGKLFDAIPYKRMFVIGAFFVALIPGMYMISPNFYYMLFWQACMGVIANGFDVVVQNNLMENSKNAKYDYLYMSNYQIYLSFIRIVFPPLGIYMYSELGIVWTFVTISVFRLIMGIVVWYGTMRNENIEIMQEPVNVVE